MKNLSGFGVHFSSDLLIVLVGELAAFVFEFEVLNIAEDYFLLSLKEIPLGFLDDCGF
jgi:hypothetical protein